MAAEINHRRLIVAVIMAVLILAMTGVPRPLPHVEQNVDSNAVFEPAPLTLAADSYVGVDTSFAAYQRAMRNSR